MKIVDDVEFVRKELEKFGFTADDLALRWVGEGGGGGGGGGWVGGGGGGGGVRRN